MDQDVRGGEETAWRGRLATLSRAEFIEKLAEADIGPDEPLHPILVMNYETSMMAWEAVKVGARGLSPEGERELIHMVAENAIGVTGQAVERLIRKATFRNSLSIALAALAILAAGFLWGDWNAPGRGSFLGSVETANDVGFMQKYCEAHTFQRDGKTACQLPPVWIRATP